MKTIYRTKLTRDFTVLPNELLRDRSLSFKARGMLGMVLSNRDEWVVHQSWLQEQGREGREAIAGGMHELERAGYAVFAAQRSGDGRLAAGVWMFYDVPVPVSERTQRTGRGGSPCHGKPYDGKPCNGKPSDGDAAAKKEHKQKEHLPKAPNEVRLNKREKNAPGGAPLAQDSLPSAEGKTLAAPTLEKRTDALLSAWKSWYKQYYQRDLILDANQKKKVSTFLKDNPGVQVKALMGYALYVWWYAETVVLAQKLEKFSWHCVNKSALPGDFVSNFTKINEDCDVSFDEMTPERITKANRKMVKLIEDRRSA